MHVDMRFVVTLDRDSCGVAPADGDARNRYVCMKMFVLLAVSGLRDGTHQRQWAGRLSAIR
jgi:hypothetical protein